jgi:predicted Zn-dependent peptidase
MGHGKNTVVQFSSRLFIDFNQQEQANYSAHFHPSFFY